MCHVMRINEIIIKLWYFLSAEPEGIGAASWPHLPSTAAWNNCPPHCLLRRVLVLLPSPDALGGVPPDGEVVIFLGIGLPHLAHHIGLK